ncbi:hypothetical protein V3Q90_15705 [Flavobacterium oreochromis]
MNNIKGLYKIILLVLFVFSSMLIISKTINGTLLFPFQDIKAFNNPRKYLIKDTLIVKSIRYDIRENDKATSDTFKFCISLQTQKGEKKIYYYQKRYKIKFVKINSIDNIIVLKNIINGNIFLDDNEYVNSEITSNYLTVILYFILFFIIIITLIKRIYVKK